MQHKVVTPPQAIEAEEAIIGCILLNPSKFKETSGYIIEDDVFYDDRNKLLWKSIKEMISEDKHWTIFVSKAGKIEYASTNEDEDEAYLKKLMRYESIKETKGGMLFKNN